MQVYLQTKVKKKEYLTTYTSKPYEKHKYKINKN